MVRGSATRRSTPPTAIRSATPTASIPARFSSCRIRSDRIPLRLRGVQLRRQDRRGAAAGLQIGLPEQAGGDRTPGLPGVADLPQRGLARPLSQLEAFGHPELQSEIAGRPNIAPAEREDQVDLGAPAADP